MIYCLNNKLDGSKYDGDAEELGADYELRELETYDNSWYWYVNGGYDGSGEIIVEHHGKWYYKNIGHCSCNAPLDGLLDLVRYRNGADNIDALVSQFSQELQRDTKILVDAIKGICEPNLNPCSDGF